MAGDAHIISFNSRCPFHARKCKCAVRVASMAKGARVYIERSRPDASSVPTTPISLGTRKQREAMHYFNNTSRILGSWGMDEFWEEILPRQAAWNEVIRDQAVALSVVQREARRGRDGVAVRTVPALEAYGRAVSSLSRYMRESDKVSRHTASICCIVLRSVARILGDGTSDVHLTYGIRLLIEQQAQKGRGNERNGRETSTMEYERRIVQRRLGGMAFMASNHGYWTPVLADADWTEAISHDPIPNFDSSLADLQKSLTGLGIAIMGLRNQVMKSGTANSKDIAKLQTSLTEWKIAADAFSLRKEPELQTDPELARKFYSCLVQLWFGEQLVDEMREEPSEETWDDQAMMELMETFDKLTIATEECTLRREKDSRRGDFTRSWRDGMVMMLSRARDVLQNQRLRTSVDRAMAAAERA